MSFSKAFLAPALIFVSMLSVSVARADFGCGFGSSYLSTWGSYGMGGGFRNAGISSCFSPSYSFCAPRPACRVSWGSCRSFSSFNPGFSCYQPSFYSCYRPLACAPRTYYSSLVAVPTICPTFVTPRWGTTHGWFPAGSYSSWCLSSYTPYYSYSSLYYGGCAPDYRLPRLQVSLDHGNANRLAAAPLKQPNPMGLVGAKPISQKLDNQKLSQEESWLVLATELVDSMAQQGGVNEGLASVEQLIRVRENLSSDIYWRAAIFASLAGRNSKQVAQYIELAKRSGTRFDPKQLPGGSLRGYVQRIPGQSLDRALNRHAQTALSDTEPADAYHVLASFLEHDGQSLRAEKFALAAQRSSAVASQSNVGSAPPKVVLGMRP